MAHDVLDEDLMRRFLVEAVTADERERVERQFIEDASALEALRALEHEMLLAHLRGELPEPWRGRLEALLSRSENMRRELAALDAFRTALVDAAAVLPRHTAPVTAAALSPAASPARTRSRWNTLRQKWASPWTGLRFVTFAALAAVVVVGVGTGLWWRSQERTSESPAPVAAQSVTLPAPIPTFALLPGLTRSPDGPSYAFQVPPAAQQVRLTLNVPAAGTGALEFELRRVGGGRLEITSRPEIRRVGDEIDIAWLVPASQLIRADYVLSVLSRATPAGAFQPIASRSFSIE